MQNRQLKAAKTPASEELTLIDEVAALWEVDKKTIEKWTEIVYLAFDVQLPKVGPFPEWGVRLLAVVGKHISKKATLYHAETGETRRLKGLELINKIRAMRQEGHFAEFLEFQKFQKSQNFQNFQPPEEDTEDLELLAEWGSVVRSQDTETHRIKQAIEAREDEQIDEIVEFMENSDQRKMAKLARRLKTRQLSDISTGQTVDASFRRLPG